MEQKIRERLSTLSEHAKSGVLGEATKKSSQEMEFIPTGDESTLRVVIDLFTPSGGQPEDMEMFYIKRMLVYQMLKCYSVLKKSDSESAHAFKSSIIENHPKVKDTAILPQFDTLTRAANAFKEVCRTSHTVVWTTCLQLNQATFEFLDKILGYLVLGLGYDQGRTLSPNILRNSFGSKVDLFKELTILKKDTYKVLLFLANPDLRNSIAHSDLFQVNGTNDLKYYSKDGKDQTISLPEYVFIGSVGTQLSQAYIIALGVISILESNNPKYKGMLPKDLQIKI